MIYIISPHVLNALGHKWLAIQKEYIERYSKDYNYQYIQFKVPDGIRHIKALHQCMKKIDEIAKQGDLIIELDSDTLPIAKNWIQKINSYLVEGYEFVAVQRLENPFSYKEMAHPCACAWIHGTPIKFNVIMNNPYIEDWETRNWKKLLRSNKRNPHQQMFAKYDEILYHHGAGSRKVEKEPFFSQGIRLNNRILPKLDEFIKSL